MYCQKDKTRGLWQKRTVKILPGNTKSKDIVQTVLDETQLLFDNLIQEYWG